MRKKIIKNQSSRCRQLWTNPKKPQAIATKQNLEETLSPWTAPKRETTWLTWQATDSAARLWTKREGSFLWIGPVFSRDAIWFHFLFRGCHLGARPRRCTVTRCYKPLKKNSFPLRKTRLFSLRGGFLIQLLCHFTSKSGWSTSLYRLAPTTVPLIVAKMLKPKTNIFQEFRVTPSP